MNKIRKITRIFAIPLLILWWLLSLIELLILFICCCLDFNINEFEACISDLGGTIKDFLKEGVEGL